MIKQFIPWLIAVLYFLSPYDAIPDLFVGPGWLDDLIILGLAYWWYTRMRQAAGNGAYRRPGDPFSAKRENPRENRSWRTDENREADPYKILGVTPKASKEEIRKAYTRLAAQYHPDKVQHLGKEFQKIAHEKFLAIQKAYDALK